MSTHSLDDPKDEPNYDSRTDQPGELIGLLGLLTECG